VVLRIWSFVVRGCEKSMVRRWSILTRQAMVVGLVLNLRMSSWCS
jgi:hypothetical protein